jgi:hypothetical protein
MRTSPGVRSEFAGPFAGVFAGRFASLSRADAGFPPPMRLCAAAVLLNPLPLPNAS